MFCTFDHLLSIFSISWFWGELVMLCWELFFLSILLIFELVSEMIESYLRFYSQLSVLLYNYYLMEYMYYKFSNTYLFTSMLLYDVRKEALYIPLKLIQFLFISIDAFSWMAYLQFLYYRKWWSYLCTHLSILVNKKLCWFKTTRK